MKQAFRLSCAAAALFVLFAGASLSVNAQTPDPFVAQVTTSARNSFAYDMSGDGRFVVIESSGDISTEKTASRNNADGNREIFLFDYAQRRIFQITNTTSARVDATKPAISTTNAFDYSNVRVEVSNNRPTISNNGRWIAFSSNASTPANFDGDANSAALIADGNQEIFLYFIPATTAVNLSSGADPAFVDLAAGTYTQITNTAASRLPTAGTTTNVPFTAFDNRDAAVNDNASAVAFVSTRDLVSGGNTDANPEIFIYRRTPSATITQLTVTGTTALNPIFNENPNLSGSGSVVAFISNANISAGGSTNNSDLNAEVYLGSFDASTSTAAVTRQVTRTTTPFGGLSINFFQPGRRLSRDGNFLVLESLADLSGGGSIQSNTTVFLYNAGANSFTQVGPRGANTSAFRFPTFTDYNASLQPATIIFATGLNFTATGTAPAQQADGLNPNGSTQIFATPVAAPTTFTRLTNNPTQVLPPGPLMQPFTSNTRERMAFSISATELGGLNASGTPETFDGSSEAFYLLSRQGTDAAGATVSFFTGASERPVVTPSPTPPAVSGLAPGMLGIIRSATALAPGNQAADSASESTHRTPLPIELNGVSVSINNAAAGLYFVSPGQITFVVPPGLTATTGTNTYPVVINNNGTTIRTTIQILPSLPDIFTVTNSFGSNRASALNVTDPLSAGSPEPFFVTTTYVGTSGPVTEATKLRFFVTGVRRVTDKAQLTVRIGTTDLTGAAIIQVMPTDLPGTDIIDVTLPASLAGAGDVTVVITSVREGVATTSRPADSAPRIRIN
ncbi:MAG TPA: hypothetical protein VJT09_20060 [Pyrinomonadaceae bacterium]|nr:hypothetical protein [Pyrinomonadaceae bacterium]